MGLTVSDAFRIMMNRIVSEKSLLFEPLVPNEVTINAMREVRKGKNIKVFNGVDDLMADLNSED